MKYFKRISKLYDKIVDFLKTKTNCPYCYSENIKFNNLTRIFGGISWNFVCKECGKGFSKTSSPPDFHPDGHHR